MNGEALGEELLEGLQGVVEDRLLQCVVPVDVEDNERPGAARVEGRHVEPAYQVATDEPLVEAATLRTTPRRASWLSSAASGVLTQHAKKIAGLRREERTVHFHARDHGPVEQLGDALHAPSQAEEIVDEDDVDGVVVPTGFHVEPYVVDKTSPDGKTECPPTDEHDHLRAGATLGMLRKALRAGGELVRGELRA